MDGYRILYGYHYTSANISKTVLSSYAPIKIASHNFTASNSSPLLLRERASLKILRGEERERYFMFVLH